MTVHTGTRFGLAWNFVAGDSGWGASFNLQARLIDALLCAVLISDTTVTPPGTPAEDDAYYVPVGATGDWVGHTGDIAAFQGGDWQYYNIPTGFRARITDRNGFYWWSGTAWTVEVTSTAGVTSVAGHTGVVTLSVGDITGAAPLSSPHLTGSPETPNQAALSRNALIANTKYVDDAISAGGVGGKVSYSGGTMTGVLNLFAGSTITTPAAGNDSTFITNTSWVRTYVASLGLAAAGSLGSAASHAATDFKAAGAVETWATLPAESQNLPIPFVIVGKPAASQPYNVMMVTAVTIAANFAGTRAFQNTQATANMIFTVNKISGGTPTGIGTLTLGTGSKTAITLSTQAQASFAAGDVLQLVAPTVQDTTGADIGITILAAKV